MKHTVYFSEDYKTVACLTVASVKAQIDQHVGKQQRSKNLRQQH